RNTPLIRIIGDCMMENFILAGYISVFILILFNTGLVYVMIYNGLNDAFPKNPAKREPYQRGMTQVINTVGYEEDVPDLYPDAPPFAPDPPSCRPCRGRRTGD